MDGGSHRANLLAGRIFALLAGHGLEVRLGRIQIAFVVGIDAQPLHVAAGLHLVPADDGDVVFRIAADDAGIAADAGVHVDRHAPGVLVVAPVGEHARRPGRDLRALLFVVREVRILLELVHRGVANNAAGRGLVAFERVSCRNHLRRQ